MTLTVNNQGLAECLEVQLESQSESGHPWLCAQTEE